MGRTVWVQLDQMRHSLHYASLVSGKSGLSTAGPSCPSPHLLEAHYRVNEEISKRVRARRQAATDFTA